MIGKCRCNRCYKQGQIVWMEHIGDTKPRSLTIKGALIEPTGKIIGKPKWKCPKCGYTRTGRGPSGADLREMLKKR